ncbi:MAG: hypothetical protein K2X64_02175 [Rhodocyclaceae bacterium]|nr:hypothetical protein [Rhodocyclaceae bacterium]
MDGISAATSLTQSVLTSTPSSRTQTADATQQAAVRAEQASQAEAETRRASELERQNEQRPAPVVNDQGQTTGTIINDTA